MKAWAGRVGLVLLLLAASCQQPGTDPDEALRSLLVSTTWEWDNAYTTDTQHFVVKFFAGGSVALASATYGTWSIKNGALTVAKSDGSQTDTTPAGTFSVTGSQLFFNYLSTLCHLKPLGS